MLRTPFPAPGFVRALGLVVAGLALGGVAPLSSAEDADIERVRFEFAPRDGSTWMMEMTDIRIQDMGAMAPRHEQETRGRFELKYERKPGGGWVVRKTPLEASMALSGEDMRNPVLEQTIGHELEVHLDDRGVAERVDGFRGLWRKLERSLDIETFERLATGQSATTMEAGEKSIWTKNLRDLVGAEVQTGEQWRVLDQYMLNGRPLAVVGRLSFDGWTEIRGLKGYKILYDFDSTGEISRALADKEINQLVWRDADLQPGMSNVDVIGRLVRVIDPASGQLIYESYRVDYSVPIGTQDSGQYADVSEEHVYRFHPVESD